MMIFRQQTFFFADTTVNIEPDAQYARRDRHGDREFVRGLPSSPASPCVLFEFRLGEATRPAKVQQAVALLARA